MKNVRNSTNVRSEAVATGNFLESAIASVDSREYSDVILSQGSMVILALVSKMKTSAAILNSIVEVVSITVGRWKLLQRRFQFLKQFLRTIIFDKDYNDFIIAFEISLLFSVKVSIPFDIVTILYNMYTYIFISILSHFIKLILEL